MKYGLDFGTTNTSIAIKQNGVSVVLPIDKSAVDPRVTRTMLYFLRRELVISKSVPAKRLNALTFTKSEISYNGEQKILVGQSAVNQYIEDNKFRTPGVIRKILTGKMVSVGAGANPVEEYYRDIDYGIGRFMQSLKTALKSPSYTGTSIFGQFYSLEKLIATFVSELRENADKQIGREVTDLVVGRPVHFSEDRDKDHAAQIRLEEALKLAGFKNIEFIFEPIAAAEQYIATSGDKDQLVFVFDFGGGTLDTAIIETKKSQSKVLAADGVYIGGDLLNADILRAKLWSYFGSNSTFGDRKLEMPHYIYESLNAWFAIPNLNNPEMMELFERLRYKNSNLKALERLIYLIKANLGFDIYEAIEKAKKQLSASETARIVFNNGPIEIDTEISKTEFEQIIQPRVDEIKELVLKTLRAANVEPDQIDVVVRTGGSSLIPIFEQMLIEIFGREKIKQFETFTSIAAGLALI